MPRSAGAVVPVLYALPKSFSSGFMSQCSSPCLDQPAGRLRQRKTHDYKWERRLQLHHDSAINPLRGCGAGATLQNMSDCPCCNIRLAAGQRRHTSPHAATHLHACEESLTLPALHLEPRSPSKLCVNPSLHTHHAPDCVFRRHHHRSNVDGAALGKRQACPSPGEAGPATRHQRGRGGRARPATELAMRTWTTTSTRPMRMNHAQALRSYRNLARDT